MTASRSVVEGALRDGRTVYGVTTGFGSLATTSIRPDELERLQVNLVRSHAAGTGPALPTIIVRTMLVLRANTLAQGASGVRPAVVGALCDLLAHDITPVVPSRGSVGASGDLAPLAHVALTLIGEGLAEIDGEVRPASEAFTQAGLTALRLSAKEGLALINGTQLMVACGIFGLDEGTNLVEHADLIGAMTVEALRGTTTPFEPHVHRLRPHRGQAQSAADVLRWMSGSDIAAGHRDDDHRVQDAYSLRCIPQVHGAARDALDYVSRVLAIEAGSVTDNPIVVPASDDHPQGAVLSAGNFHGQPIAIVLDVAKIALITVASISEPRTARLVDAALSDGLPAFLSPAPGLRSGYMVLQYTAAALVNELQSLGHPASIHSLPTSANQEDHVSMGATAGLQLLDVIDRVGRVLAIEALCAAQALEFRLPLRPGRGVEAAWSVLREVVPRLDEDRPPATDIEVAVTLVRDRRMVAAAREACAGER